jgi:hypothetical protein
MTQDTERRVFKYEIPARRIRGILWVLAALGLMFAFVASQSGSVDFWVLAVLSVLAGLGVIWWSFRKSGDPKQVILRADLLVIPRASVNGGFISVRYSDIWSVTMRDVASDRMLVLSTRLGESRLLASAFANIGEFSQFSSVVLANWEANKRSRATNETRAPETGR